ncbi:uncharacterized protein LOC118434597 [Folsomia candida]|nr:uncharacterized protein LOC118434597 [Folsomia candida]
MEMLKKCSNAEKPLDISDTDGPLITEVGITIGDHLESVPVEPQEEMADGLDSLDLVVDSFWHMFSFAFGTCYPFMTNKATESALLKHAFLKDFMDDLMFRWREGGSPPMLYGPIFGEIDLLQAIVNSRACVTAAYLDNQLDDRQLIRPLELSGHNDSFPEYNEGLGFSY